jgi:hypothetical protein
MNRPNYITPAGFAALRAEYDRLFGDERPKLVETISWAAGNGDRSENGDYIYGRKRLREIDRTLGRLSATRRSSPTRPASISAPSSPSPTKTTISAPSPSSATTKPTQARAWSAGTPP